MRVFISHSSQDKLAVEKLALGLRERGIEPWLDKWEIGLGDDIVASINAGLEQAQAGLIVFSRHSRESRWVEAEASYLTYARIAEGKVLIPVVLGEDYWVPPLLRPLARRGIEEIEAIADGLLNRRARPAPARAPEAGQLQRVLITLRREAEAGVRVQVRIGDQDHGGQSHSSLPPALIAAQASFLHGFRSGLRGSPDAAERAALESSVVELGRELRRFCLPGDTGAALANLADGCPVGTTVEVCVEAEQPKLLGLPFEALRLPDDRLLATLPSVVMWRRPLGLKASAGETLAGPIKILVAVGAPDEDQTPAVVLDQERELQTILDAVALARAKENIEVRILEVGHPEVIGAALQADAYHVLHLSCHGLPGALELEDEGGRAVRTTADGLLAPLRRAGRPLPLILLNACHGGVQDGRSASLAEALLRAGVPAVLAMQTSVSDAYATQLAGAFYRHLARRELHLPSRALAEARKELERVRLQAIQRGAPLAETQPEYATAALFVAGEERPLADFALDKQPLRTRPVYELPGPVPQLRIDDLIGRRKELRETLRTLRDETRQYAGVVLTGIGGVGKSATAGRAMQRLTEDGCLVAAHAGRFDLAGIGLALGAALLQSPDEPLRQRGELLCRHDLDDRVCMQLLARSLAEERVVLVLDDFEQNLQPGGGAFLDPSVAVYLRMLLDNARRGRLLITSRYPVPGTDAYLWRIPIGPLSPAQTRKLLLRLPALKDLDTPQLGLVLRVIGGHPRMLEFLDALLRGGQGRMAHVTDKLQRLLAEQGLPPQASMRDLDEALQAAVLLGARDVFLQELLDLARREGSDEVLLQAAASNLPITPAGLARALGGADGDATPLTQALARLEHLSLLHRFADGCVWVHHWTAQGLARLVDAHAQGARHIRAGRYRLWRVEHESHSLDDAVEAVRNFAAGQDFDAAVASAQSCFAALTRFGQTVGIAGLASELLETLSPEHPGFAAVADQEAQAHLALGFMDRAVARYTQLQTLRERLAAAEPQRADYQRDLSVSYIKVGDLYRALGQGEQAREAYLQALAIHERLAAAEPERADYQRDLVASLHRVGAAEDPPATEHLQRALSILEALQHSGRLAPVDEPMVAALRQLLRDLGPSDQSTP